MKQHLLAFGLVATALAGVGGLRQTMAAPVSATVPADLAVDPGAPNWNGIWVRSGPLAWDPTVPNGQFDQPPLTPEYQALYKRGLDSMAAGHPANDPTAGCLPPGMPRMMNAIYPLEIFQRPGQVAIFAEWDHQVRRIFTDGRKHPPPDELEPTYNGHSIGHWEGDTLVVDTVGLRGDMMITQNGLGLSDALHITERIRQTDAVTLTDTFTFEDSKALTRPWVVMKTYKRDPKVEIMEYACQENNRNPILPDGTTGVILK
jgi:hypothetical protein